MVSLMAVYGVSSEQQQESLLIVRFNILQLKYPLIALRNE